MTNGIMLKEPKKKMTIEHFITWKVNKTKHDKNNKKKQSLSLRPGFVIPLIKFWLVNHIIFKMMVLRTEYFFWDFCFLFATPMVQTNVSCLFCYQNIFHGSIEKITPNPSIVQVNLLYWLMSTSCSRDSLTKKYYLKLMKLRW